MPAASIVSALAMHHRGGDIEHAPHNRIDRRIQTFALSSGGLARSYELACGSCSRVPGLASYEVGEGRGRRPFLTRRRGCSGARRLCGRRLKRPWTILPLIVSYQGERCSRIVDTEGSDVLARCGEQHDKDSLAGAFRGGYSFLG